MVAGHRYSWGKRKAAGEGSQTPPSQGYGIPSPSPGCCRSQVLHVGPFRPCAPDPPSALSHLPSPRHVSGAPLLLGATDTWLQAWQAAPRRGQGRGGAACWGQEGGGQQDGAAFAKPVCVCAWLGLKGQGSQAGGGDGTSRAGRCGSRQGASVSSCLPRSGGWTPQQAAASGQLQMD